MLLRMLGAGWCSVSMLLGAGRRAVAPRLASLLSP